MIRPNDVSENKLQESFAGSGADFCNAINQLAVFISSQPAMQQIHALVKLEVDLKFLQMQAVKLLSHGEGLQAEVCRQAEIVFNDDAADWLFGQNWALGWKAPAEMLNSDEGAQMVLDTLGRIQHGVLS